MLQHFRCQRVKESGHRLLLAFHADEAETTVHSCVGGCESFSELRCEQGNLRVFLAVRTFRSEAKDSQKEQSCHEVITYNSLINACGSKQWRKAALQSPQTMERDKPKTTPHSVRFSSSQKLLAHIAVVAVGICVFIAPS